MATGSTRRAFLKQMTAAAVAPMALPSVMLGRRTPGDKAHLALIGAGGRGSSLLGQAMQVEDARVVAICDCFRERRERIRDSVNAHYGNQVAEAYADFRDVLAREDVDGVIVATPDHWHVPVALAAARACKGMYVEKPLGVSLRWAWKLREAVKANGCVFQYGTQQRSAGQFRKACELVLNGHLGEITQVEAWCPDISTQYNAFHVPEFGATDPAPVPDGFDYEMWVGPAPEKPYTVDRCTCFGAYHIYDYALGFIAGWGAHPLDIAQWGLGMDASGPVRYEGQGTLPTKGLYDTVASWDVNCTYANGVVMRFMGHRVAEPVVTAYRPWKDHGTTFFGSKGWISVDRSGIHASDPAILEKEPGEKRLKASDHHMGDFVSCIRTGETPVSSLEAGIRSDTISHLSDIAIRLGRVVQWDPAKEELVGDADGKAAAMLDRPVRKPWDLDAAMVTGKEGKA